MKTLLILIGLLLIGWGRSSRNSEMIGQVKKVAHVTPLICPQRTDVELSLGVIRNGVGSMSTEDNWLTVSDPKLAEILERANQMGALVKVTYDVYRFTFCEERRDAVNVELMK